MQLIMSTSCYLGPGFTYLQNSVCLMTGPDLPDSRPWTNPLVRPHLPLLRGKMKKR